ncbi:hypothetical protein E0Z10_g7272 [Xylaria hypoxylon]|uniref:Uncharacterized protein n=1 Tax=Xylaria hypoxylon TaxID=37992 RepID=A0A4Z0YR19_9PEZI|nr:hypothetical protein E0Z10_g7272 [Xylaria hypoxylon]
MANIGNLVAAGISARNENTLALANLNFDFSLVKIDAPKEFLQLGKTLSPWRRKNAEEGSTHRTARKLGALFEQVATPPEGLVTAYGRRASEISQALEARQAGKQLGLFSDHAGADATVLWAAAVSGKTAIAVALLACMLARIWEAPKATSIWVELVEKRKEQIQHVCDGSELSHQALIAASRQDITRRELAEWDASARSWLDIADIAKETEHQRMEAVLLKLSLPVDNSTDVFTSVLRVWKTAMMAMENLCKGIPQRVHNGAVLLAITSWHLYPDVNVFGGETECVIQNDVLVSPGGRLTVGLFAAWQSKDFDPLLDQEKGAKFVVALWESLERIASDASSYTPKGQARFIMSTPNHWLHILASAAGALLESNKKGCTTARKLVSLGVRQGCSLVQSRMDSHAPCFGLFDARKWPQFALRGESVRLLRELAKKLELDKMCSRAIIHLGDEGLGDDQFTTVFPLHSASELNQDEERLQHVRWKLDSEEFLPKPPPYEQSSDKVRMFNLSQINKRGSIVHCARSLWVSLPIYARSHIETEFEELHHLLGNNTEGLYVHSDIVHSFDSANSPRKPTKKSPQKKTQKLTGIPQNLTYLTLEDMMSLLEANLINTGLLILYLSYSIPIKGMHSVVTTVKRRFPFGDANTNYLNIKEQIPSWMYTIGGSDYRNSVTNSEEDTPYSRIYKVPELGDNSSDETIESEASEREIDEGGSSIHTRASARKSDVGEGRIGQEEARTEWGRRNIFSAPRIKSRTFTSSMQALSVAANIWSCLPDATISLNIIKHSLWSAPWLPDFNNDDEFESGHAKPTIDVSRAFSCIAMLETGDLAIPPSQLEHVFAISIRNTIYAAAALLADPYTNCPQHEMRMIYGNVGRPGVSLMIPPANPVLRKPKLESWKFINHEPFTAGGKCDDMFSQTSLHLAFTGYEQSVAATANHGARDLEACYLETVVTAFDGREKVGDLDILGAADKGVFSKIPTAPACSHSSRALPCPRWIMVDSWEELLEMPSGNICIIRAHGNALSRLATAVVCAQKGVDWCFILPPDPCYFCVEEHIQNKALEGTSLVLIC